MLIDCNSHVAIYEGGFSHSNINYAFWLLICKTRRLNRHHVARIVCCVIVTTGTNSMQQVTWTVIWVEFTRIELPVSEFFFILSILDLLEMLSIFVHKMDLELQVY